MAKRLALAALLALVPAAAAAQSVNPPAAIVDAAADCWGAVGETRIDQAALVAKGWKPSEFKGKGGKAVATPLKFYSKSQSGVMLMVLPSGKSPACTVMSRVSGEPGYRQLVSLLLQRLKSLQPDLKAGRGGKGGAAFMGDNRIALLEATGTKAAPAARIIVGYSPSEKK